MNARTTMIALGAAVVFVIGSASGASAPSFEQGRLSKEQIKAILAEAVAEQNNKTPSQELVLDSRGLAAALNVFQKNFGGMSGFLRNPQAKQPPVTHTVSDLQKKLGKDLTPKEPADVEAMAAAVENCVAYLSSPGLVSYMEPDVARATRLSANNTLQTMNEASTSITGADLHVLLSRTKGHLSQTAAVAEKYMQIPTELAAIQGIESALDQGKAAAAIEGWKRFTSGQLPTFSFTQKYLDGTRTLMADVGLYDSCESTLSSLASPQAPSTHAQELLAVYKCRDLAEQKPNTIAFLDSVEPGIRQDVAKDFGMLPARDDLAGWLETNQRLSAPNIGSSPQQRIAAIADILALKNRYGALPATSALISQKLDQQVQSLETVIAKAPSCEVGGYRASNSVSAKDRDSLSALLTKLRVEENTLSKTLEQCEPLARDSASTQPVLGLLQPDIRNKLKMNAEQFQLGREVLQALNSRSAEVEQQLHHLDEVEAARTAQIEAQKRTEERQRRIAEVQEAEKKKAADEASDADACNLVATNKMGVSPQAREEYAEKATQTAADKMGPDVIYNTAAGENKRYLLIAAPPEHVDKLNGFALAMANSLGIRASLCSEGFSEVQFIVRYADGYNQKMVKRVKLSFHETVRYAFQTSGARPEP